MNRIAIERRIRELQIRWVHAALRRAPETRELLHALRDERRQVQARTE